MSELTDSGVPQDGLPPIEWGIVAPPLGQHAGVGTAAHAAPTEPAPDSLPDPAEMTDEWHARRLVDLHADRLRYCPALGGWAVYDGRRWRTGDSVAPERLARNSVRSLYERLRDIRDKSDRRDFEAAIRKAESLRTLKAMLGLARSDERIGVAPDGFDRDPYLFNCLNGTIDLRTGRLRPHDPADLIAKLAPVSYDPDANCPLWESALLRSMNGDEEMVAFLRRAAGSALTGDTRDHCMFLLYGTGRNGKTLMLQALLNVVGRDYGMMAPSHLLTISGRDKHATAVADLDGKRLVGISEPPGGRFDEERVKSLTGGESIRANRMHCNYFEFDPAHKFFIATNHRLASGEFTNAFWSRIRLVEFGVTIRPDQQDKDLPAKLRAEAEGILSWMVRGCLEWQAIGLAEPQKVRQDTASYRDEMDPISGFLDACCVRGQGLRVRSSCLLAAYKEWCGRESIPPGERAESDTKFGKILNQKGFKAKKSGGVMWRLGLDLKTATEGDPASQV